MLNRDNEKRTACLDESPFRACITCERSAVPDEQALPVEAAIPSISRLYISISPESFSGIRARLVVCTRRDKRDFLASKAAWSRRKSLNWSRYYDRMQAAIDCILRDRAVRAVLVDIPAKPMILSDETIINLLNPAISSLTQATTAKGNRE